MFPSYHSPGGISSKGRSLCSTQTFKIPCPYIWWLRYVLGLYYLLDQIYTWPSAFGCDKLRERAWRNVKDILKTRPGGNAQHLHSHSTAITNHVEETPPLDFPNRRGLGSSVSVWPGDKRIGNWGTFRIVTVTHIREFYFMYEGIGNNCYIPMGEL